MAGTRDLESNSKSEGVADQGAKKTRDAWEKPVLVRVSAALAEIGGTNGAIDEASHS